MANDHREYWTRLSFRVRARVLPAVFFTFVSVGFASDLLDAVQRPFWWVLVLCAWFGLMSAGLAVVLFRRRTIPAPLIVLIVVAHLALFVASSRIPSTHLLTGPAFVGVRVRLVLDAALWLCTSLVGYVLLLRFITTEGAKQVRTSAELELAAQVQRTLVPPLHFRAAGCEVHGQSVSSSQMGGDVVDAHADAESVLCYIADVSGHGIQAGVFMAMVKSCVRAALLHTTSLGALLSDANRVLCELKGNSPTYVTFACVRCRRTGDVEYSLAGHGPILHYHSRSKTVTALSLQQFPLGWFADAVYGADTTRMEPGDRLLLSTDGVTEVFDEHDNEFGLQRLESLLIASANVALASVLPAILVDVRAYGQQTDDQSLLLIGTIPEEDERGPGHHA